MSAPPLARVLLASARPLELACLILASARSRVLLATARPLPTRELLATARPLARVLLASAGSSSRSASRAREQCATR